jgi:hypothetical protein
VVGALWSFEVQPLRAAEFERHANDAALPIVRGQMGCQAALVLRGSESGRYAWLMLWVSRRAMRTAVASAEWASLTQSLAPYGVSLDPDAASSYESVALFLAGEKPDAPGGAGSST